VRDWVVQVLQTDRFLGRPSSSGSDIDWFVAFGLQRVLTECKDTSDGSTSVARHELIELREGL